MSGDQIDDCHAGLLFGIKVPRLDVNRFSHMRSSAAA